MIYKQIFFIPLDIIQLVALSLNLQQLYLTHK